MKIKILILTFLAINLYAENKLDILDKQSRDFFKAITGLEKNYLEKQIENIQNKNSIEKKQTNQYNNIYIEPTKKDEVSKEELEKNIFRHQNDMARLTSEFTRSKQLKDIKIKSMYSFNGNNYVVLKTDKKQSEEDTLNKELSLDIEGRYKKGDYLLTHKIIDINRRTKTVKLYKKLDETYGYYIFLSNYGISVSKLEKKLSIKSNISKTPINNGSSCLYTVKVNNLNVRNTYNQNALILRVLKQLDRFSISNRVNDWVQIDTIYKNSSGDIMKVIDKNNWVQLTNENVIMNKTCK